MTEEKHLVLVYQGRELRVTFYPDCSAESLRCAIASACGLASDASFLLTAPGAGLVVVSPGMPSGQTYHVVTASVTSDWTVWLRRAVLLLVFGVAVHRLHSLVYRWLADRFAAALFAMSLPALLDVSNTRQVSVAAVLTVVFLLHPLLLFYLLRLYLEFLWLLAALPAWAITWLLHLLDTAVFPVLRVVTARYLALFRVPPALQPRLALHRIDEYRYVAEAPA